MSNLSLAAASAARSGIQTVERAVASRAIGWSRIKIRNSNRGSIVTKESIEVQAWELGILALGLAVYEYVKGGQSSTSGSNLPGWIQSLENWNQGGTLIKW